MRSEKKFKYYIIKKINYYIEDFEEKSGVYNDEEKFKYYIIKKFKYQIIIW